MFLLRPTAENSVCLKCVKFSDTVEYTKVERAGERLFYIIFSSNYPFFDLSVVNDG